MSLTDKHLKNIAGDLRIDDNHGLFKALSEKNKEYVFSNKENFSSDELIEYLSNFANK